MFTQINAMTAKDEKGATVRVLPRQYLEYQDGDFLAAINYNTYDHVVLIITSLLMTDASRTREEILQHLKQAAEVIFDMPVVAG